MGHLQFTKEELESGVLSKLYGGGRETRTRAALALKSLSAAALSVRPCVELPAGTSRHNRMISITRPQLPPQTMTRSQLVFLLLLSLFHNIAANSLLNHQVLLMEETTSIKGDG